MIQIRFYDGADAPLSSAIAVAADRGTPSDPVTVRLYNEGGDPARSVRLLGELLTPDPERSGNQWMDRHWIEARVVAGLAGLTAAATSWRSIGSGSWLPLPNLAAGQGVEVEVRANVTGDGATVAAEIGLAVELAPSASVPQGLLEVAGAGVYLGLHDGAFGLHVAGANVAPNPAGADDQVLVPYQGAVVGGRAVGWSAALLELDDQDAEAETLAAGEAYWAALSIGASGLTVTKGAKSAGLTDDDRPAMPAGERPLAYVRRDEDAAIDSADIANVWRRDGFGLAASGLTATIGPGVALVDGAMVESTGDDSITVEASETSTIWLLRDGSLGASTDGLPPSPRALLLWEVDADGSAITAARDRRHWIGHAPLLAEFTWDGTLSSPSYRYGHVPTARPSYILPVRGIIAALGEQASGASSGSTSFDLEYWDGSAWQSVFGATAERPAVAYDATELAAIGLPETLALPAGARLRASIAGVTAGGAAATGARLVLRLAA